MDSNQSSKGNHKAISTQLLFSRAKSLARPAKLRSTSNKLLYVGSFLLMISVVKAAIQGRFNFGFKFSGAH